MDIPADSVPPELKSICEQILKRGRELRKVDPVMSYWCCFSAATACMRVSGKRSDESMKFLLNLVTILEDMKKQLLEPDSGVEHITINDESAGSAYVEDFAMKVFIGADDEDRAGRSNKHSIRKFMVASQFLEVLRCFEPPNGMREELEQKQQYAKWKATDIAKALREGRKPTPGPPLSEDEAAVDHMLPDDNLGGSGAPAFPSIPQSGGMPSDGAGPSGLGSPSQPIDIDRGLDTPPERKDSLESGTWSTAATPGLRDGDDSEKMFPSTTASSSRDVSSDRANGSSGNDDRTDGMDGVMAGPGPGRGEGAAPQKGVRFAGPDGVPLSPPTTVFSVDSYSAPGNPPPSEFDDGLEGDVPPPPAKQPAFPSAPPSHPADKGSTYTLPSAPASPPPTSYAAGPSAPPPQAPLPQSLDTKTIELCQKHAKWAVSALDYEDLDTARLELRKALALLGVST